MFKLEVQRMIFPWMPSFLKSYFPAPIDPSSFSAKHTINGLQSSVTFNNSRLDYSEQRNERTKSYKPILPKSDDHICYSGPPKRHWGGARCNKTSLLRY